MLNRHRYRRAIRVCKLVVPAFLAGSLVACTSSGRTNRPAPPPTLATQPAEDVARMDQEVAELRQAYEQKRGTDLQIRLAEAESRAADAHVAQARQHLGGRRLRQARRELGIAIEHVPAHPQAVTLAREVDRDIQRSDDLAKRAQQAASLQDIKAALQLAEQALAIDAEQPAARQIVETLRGRTLAEHLKQANDAMEQGNWDAAATAAAKAREIAPDNTQAKAIEKTAGQRKLALQLIESARAAAAKGEHLTAVKSFREAAGLWPENADIAAERDRTTQAAVDAHQAKAEIEIKAGRFEAALAEIDAALAVLPGDSRLTRGRQAIVGQQLQALQDRYERLALSGEWELAWPAAVELAVHRPADDAQAIQNMARAEEIIRQRTRYRLRVVPLASGSVSADNVLAVAHEIAGELDRAKPVHVSVMPFETTAEALATNTLKLSEVGDAAKLKALDADFTDQDLCLFVEIVARQIDASQAKSTTNENRARLEQARLNLQQAREALNRARQLAMADERKWDPQAQAALAAEDTFLPKALTGTYGPQAQRAAESYQAALHRLQQLPEQGSGQSPSVGEQGHTCIRVPLRLVQATTGRILWSDDEIEVPVPHAPPGGAVPSDRTVDLQTETVRDMTPVLQNKARESLVRRSMAYLDDAGKAKGDEAVRLYARFLFDLSSDPGPHVTALAIDEVFSKQARSQQLEAFRKLAAQRLKLKLGPAATQPAPPAATSAPAPASPAPLSPPPAARAAAPQAVPRQPITPAKPPAAEPSPTPVQKAEPIQAFEGHVSRDDKRYPNERLTVDGITFTVRDTDADPLDADIEIRVGSYRGKFDDLRVGTRLRIRGTSGQDYHITILGIEDANETVRFSLERLPTGSNR
ncbi:MAG TPA: hypothetical protein VLM89_03395 [Phycisphaerae bacterium]|nr:hypothetical protein [Phycisphaerae bacterium]